MVGVGLFYADRPSPLYDTANCSAGQLGTVWFLGGTFTATSFPGGSTGNVDRKCTVPTGTYLFFPIINSEAATLENDLIDLKLYGCKNSPSAPFKGLSCKARYYQNHATGLYATIDGVDVENLQSYRVQSPLFQYGPLPLNNVPCNIGFGSDCTDLDPAKSLIGKTSDFVGDGVYLLLPPLPAGKHEIKFGGQAIYAISNGDAFDFTFTLDGVYHITVVAH
jgi:hypothetical protein